MNPDGRSTAQLPTEVVLRRQAPLYDTSPSEFSCRHRRSWGADTIATGGPRLPSRQRISWPRTEPHWRRYDRDRAIRCVRSHGRRPGHLYPPVPTKCLRLLPYRIRLRGRSVYRLLSARDSPWVFQWRSLANVSGRDPAESRLRRAVGRTSRDRRGHRPSNAKA